MYAKTDMYSKNMCGVCRQQKQAWRMDNRQSDPFMAYCFADATGMMVKLLGDKLSPHMKSTNHIPVSKGQQASMCKYWDTYMESMLLNF